MDEFGERKPILNITDDPSARDWMRRKLMERAAASEKVSGYMAPEDLSPELRAAFEMAIAEREKSADKVLTVGVVAIDTVGNMVAVHNDGQQGHAEQLAITKLFELPNSSRALKSIVLVGGAPETDVPETDDPRIPRDAKPEDMCVFPCGKCREFMHDRTGNVDDVEVYSLARNGMVYSTYLNTLYPNPYTSRKVPTRDQWPGAKVNDN